MEKQFVPYYLAVKMKEVGFHDSCMASYYTNDESNKTENYNYKEKFFGLDFIPCDSWGLDFEPNFIKNSDKKYYVSAPLWQQSFDWFYDKGYRFSIDWHAVGDMFWFEVFCTEEGHFKFQFESAIEYQTKKEVEIALLEKLIELHK